jgi:hypothetical protein
LQFGGHRGAIGVGERAIRTFDSKRESALHHEDHGVESGISRLKLALDRAQAVEVTLSDGDLVMVLDQDRGGGGVVGGLIHSAAGGQFQQRFFSVLTGAVERRQQVGHGIGIDTHVIRSRD